MAATDQQHTDDAQRRAERDEILAEIEGRTLIDVFMAVCDAHGGRDALVIRDGDGFATTTWSGYRSQASAIGMALHRLGVGHGEAVALMMSNRPEHVIADIGALLAGAVPVSVYNTLAREQLAYVAGHSAARVAIVEDVTFLGRWLEVSDDLAALQRIVVVDPRGVDAFDDPRVMTYDDLVMQGEEGLEGSPEALEACWRAVQPDDPATLIYTSGTTGPPKGVVLTHRNILYMLGVVDRVLDIRPGQRGLSYLPLAHVAERMVTHYVGLRYGGTIYFVNDMAAINETLQEARPHLFMAVPRVWEKMHAAVLGRIDEDARRGPIARRAIAVATEVVERERDGRRVPVRLRAQTATFERLVFRKIRAGLGLDELRIAISGAAAISTNLLVFYKAIGIDILEVYGMTETTAVVTANLPGRTRLGTVGHPLPGVEVRLRDDGEIVARGPNITPGYWQDDDATAEVLEPDGWLHTGDLGRFDEDGYLTIIGRKKELIVTAAGKNISPANIESSIKDASTIIGQICAIGDDRPFIAALVVLDAERLPSFCAALGIDCGDVVDAIERPEVREEVQRAVEEGNARLSRVEQVKQWALVPAEWVPGSDELTPSMKVKRHVVQRKYADLIEALYQRHG